MQELSTSRVLVMEYLDGIKVAHSEQLRAAGYDLSALARKGAELFLQMIFENGLQHHDFMHVCDAPRAPSLAGER